jgi:hypothetical protein
MKQVVVKYNDGSTVSADVDDDSEIDVRFRPESSPQAFTQRFPLVRKDPSGGVAARAVSISLVEKK